ncbi:MAG: PD-(D/E)XK nuclease family protein [Acidimicrobiales bacterium]
MAITLHTTAYGEAAHLALAAAIDRAKAGLPLEPVTVVVPSNHVGIAARRALGRRGGVAAVTFLTPYRLAELLGAARVASTDRRPVSTPILAGAVRAVLHSDPGHFAGVHTHPATERSLVRAHQALSEVSAGGLAAIAATSHRAADVVRVHRAVGDLLGPHFSTEQDLVTAAIAALADRPPVLAELGRAIAFLPQRLSTSQTDLLRAFGEASELAVIAGITGDAQADAAVRDAVDRLGIEWPTATDEPEVAIADRGLSVSDADDEVRHAVRAIVDAARRGVPLGRCAVLYGSRDPYARLLGDAFDAAGIEWFGSSVQTADASLLGRSLLALLALGDHDFSRRDVAAWLASAPIRGVGNRPAPVAAWERASRAAGVVGGATQWADRLSRLADELEGDATRSEMSDEETWRAERLRRDATHARELATFMTTLVADLDPGGRGASWSGLASWCRSLVRSYLGSETLREGWPDDERAAAQRVDAAIDRLGDLDGIDPAPSVGAFRRALELQLADDLGRHGSFGNGVLIGSAHLAIGLELDTVFVVGMAEGSFPARRRDDPLLPDRVRTVTGRDLPPRSEGVHDDHRALLAVMAAAGHLTMTFPRGDLRRSAERAPSRWLLDSVEAHDGVRPAAADIGRATGDWFREIPSFIAALRSTDFPAHVQEYDVRTMLDAADAGHDLGDIALLADRPELRRGVDLITGRGSTDFTRFDGNLATDGDLRGVRLPTPRDADHVTSATRLEAWAGCPHAYFLRHVLGIHPVEDPEEQYRITALNLGSLVHHALDRWMAETIDSDAVPEPGIRWSTDQRDRLLEIATDEAERIAGKGLVGRAVYWARDRRVVLDDLTAFLEMDHQLRAAHGARPRATELPFGMPHSSTPPVEIELPSGRPLRIRGSIDRVDETHDGELIVIDYKTGQSKYYKDLSESSPTPGGRFLQLALYAAAARVVMQRPDAATRGAYWFVTKRGGYSTAGYRVTDEVARLALGTVEAIVDGIAAGVFPQVPDQPGWRMFVGCEFCEPDGLGTAHQYADHKRISDHPGLALWRAVTEEV